MRRRWPALGALLLAGVAGGCEPTPTRILLPGPEVILHAVLEEGADSVFVHLHRAEIGSGEWGGVDLQPISDAVVELAWSTGRALLQEQEGEPRCSVSGWGPFSQTTERGCYVARLDEPVKGGEHYTVHALLATGEVVTGRLEMQGALELLTPAPGERFSSRRVISELETDSTLILSWSAGASAALVRIHAEVVRVHAAGAEGTRCDLIAPVPVQMDAHPEDFPAWRIRMRCGLSLLGGWMFVHPDSVALRLTVSSFDERFVRYLAASGSSAVRRDELSLGLEGAVGLFSGIVTESREIVIHPAEPIAGLLRR